MLSSSRRQSAIKALTMAAALAVGQQFASAQNYFEWTGATDTLWNTPTNWNPEAPNGPGGANDNNMDIAVFNIDGTATMNVNGKYIYGLQFGDGITFTLNRNSDAAARILGGGITVGENSTITLADVTVNGGNTFFYMNFPATLDIGAGSTFTHSIHRNNQINTLLTKTGAGIFRVENSGATSLTWGTGFGLDIQQGVFEFNSTTNARLGDMTRLTTSPGTEFKVTTGGQGAYHSGPKLHVFTDNVFAGSGTGNFGWLAKYGTASFKIVGQGYFTGATGGIWIKEGTVELDYTGGGNAGVNKIADTARIAMNNGILRIKSATDGDVVEQMGYLSLSPGSDHGGMAQIIIENPGPHTTTLRFTNVSNNSSHVFYGGGAAAGGGFLRFIGVDGVNNRVMFGNQAIAPNGILGGFAVVRDGDTVDYAAYDHGAAGDGPGVTRLSTAGRPTDFSSANNNTLLSAGMTNLGADATIHSLKIDGDHQLNLGGNTLTINSGGIIQSAGSATTLTGGTLNVGSVRTGGFTTRHLFIYADGDVTLDAPVTGLETSGWDKSGVSKAGKGTLTITANATLNNPVIRWVEGSLIYQGSQDGDLFTSGQGYASGSTEISGDGKLVLDGTGVLQLRGTLANTGGTEINAGALKLDPSHEAVYYRTTIDGAGTVRIAGGAALWYVANGSINNTTIAGNGSVVGNTALDGSGTRRTITSTGVTWAPGDSAGILTVDANLTFSSSPSEIVIDVIGSGATPGVDFDLLEVLGNISGLNNVDLIVNPLVDNANEITILVGEGLTAGSQFRSVQFAPGTTGDISFNAGSVTLSNIVVPEPTSLGILAIGAIGLLARRRRAG